MGAQGLEASHPAARDFAIMGPKASGKGGKGGLLPTAKAAPGVQKSHTKKKKRGGGGGGGNRVPYAELPEERKQKIRARHEARTVKEGRVEAGAVFYTGTVVARGRQHGWVKPLQPFKLPKAVQTKMKEMTAEKKAKALENGMPDNFEAAGVIYMRMSDVAEGVKVDAGDTVQFRAYTDAFGAGACDVFKE
eukprot:NODE_4323_length_685_cov_379.487302.p1 GENE.NODE_4323_length_685_cov_379.487302~~NODE_4323_length_685_cov_379.487302.p1  ORF type:complete len:191 (-),score=84.18 NODE_4323_length_685_cov_379.487302:95-667(-)